MKKFVLFLLALAMVAMSMVAFAEEPLTDQNFGENISLTDNIPVVGEVLEIEEYVDLDAEEEDEEGPEPELEWLDPEEDEEGVEVEDVEDEIIEYVDLDAENLIFPEVCGEVLNDTFELSEPAIGSPIAGGHYKGELLWVVDVIGDYWLLQNGNYVSVDDVAIYNEMEIPGESEVKTRVNPRVPRNFKVVLCDPASEVESIVEKYHSVVILDTVDLKLHVFKYGVETLEVSLVPMSELSQLYSYWSIDEDFLQEDAYLIGWEEVVEKVFAYSLPGSYMVIFQ